MQYEDDIKQYLRVFYVAYKLDRFTTLIKNQLLIEHQINTGFGKKQDLFKNSSFL